MSIKEPSDSAVRLVAIDPTQSFLIQAPAGSGKTELLTDRILALLATVSRPEALSSRLRRAERLHVEKAELATELAAGEEPACMRHRIEHLETIRNAVGAATLLLREPPGTSEAVLEAPAARLIVPYAGRGRRVDEAIEVLRLILGGGMVEFHGEFFDFDGAMSYPKPIQPGGVE